MPHLLVAQLRFARSELVRCLDGVSAEDAVQRISPMNGIGAMNCISWIVGHLAFQEKTYWVEVAQGQQIAPGLYDLVGWGKPASTPPLAEMWATWREVTAAADGYLETLTPEIMMTHFERQGNPVPENVGTLLLRNIDHYWFHTGEAHAIRQMLGHKNLPDFVGNISVAAYRPEVGS
jgi:uncharacterized damage-inducible protein DinB